MAYDIVQLTEDLDLPPVGEVLTGARLVLQRVRLRINTHRGEVLRDAALGLPYLEWAETMPAPVSAITSALIQEIIETPGVSSVRDQRASFDPVTQTYSLQVLVILDDESEAIRLSLQPELPDQLQVPWAVVMLELLQ